MKTEQQLRDEEEKAAQPKYAPGLRVWYYANFVRHEGEISEVRQRGTAFSYRVGPDWVPQNQLLPV